MPQSIASQVGSLVDGLPGYVYEPPIEAVVFAFGVAEDGQLGLDTVENVITPKVVEALLGTRFRGREFGRAPLVAGSRNTLAIDAEGQVLAWGWNGRGTLGHGHRGNERKPRRVAGLRGIRVVQVAIGGWHALAVDEAGQMWAWGGNEYHQCGITLGLRDVPIPTKILPDLKVQQVSAGGMHSLALTENGELWMWGEPWGDFSVTIDRRPRRIDTASDFVAISCGAFHNLALNAQGEVYSWGINDFGQLGNGTTSYASTPERVVGLEGVVIADVAAGGWHSLALSTEGEVYVWGRGEYGRLGLGDRTGSSKLRPLKVKALEGHRVVQGSCGGTHTVVVTDEGRCFIWGRGAFGRLGMGDEKNHISPVELKLPGGPERWHVISASTGGRHTMVLALPVNNRYFEDEVGRASSARSLSYRLTPPMTSPASQLYPTQSWVGEADDEASPDGGSADGGSPAEGQSPYTGLSPTNSAFPLDTSSLIEGNSLGGTLGGLRLTGAGGSGALDSASVAGPSPSPPQPPQRMLTTTVTAARLGSPPLGPVHRGGGGALGGSGRRDSLQLGGPGGGDDLDGDSDFQLDSASRSHALAAATVALGLRDDAPGKC